MSSTSALKLYISLSEKVGTENAQLLLHYIDEKIKSEVSKNVHLIREDNIAEELHLLRYHITETKTDLIKWMFIFWIAQIVTTFGLLLLFLKR